MLATDEIKKELTISAAKYKLGMILSNEIRTLADKALDKGEYTPELAEIALDKYPILSTVGPLFEKVLQTYSIPLPNEENAIWTMLSYHLHRIVDKTGIPRCELCKIREISFNRFFNSYGSETFEIDKCISLFWTYDVVIHEDATYKDKTGKAAIEVLDLDTIEFARDWLSKHKK